MFLTNTCVRMVWNYTS